MRRLYKVTWLFSFVTALNQIAKACPVCYGANDSPMNAGMNSAIIVLLGITGFVLGGFVTFFAMVWRRMKRRQTQISNHAFVDELGDLQVNNDKGIVEWNNF